ncbi:O-acetylhomoserine aminocarboxypropyltransferase [Kordiimonas pumila]|uniref:O-acetylhomoserine aminocarboxypropyltransferase n=1 Tax=Kordiimonas pumila TaxID=2161677 RepID=A0ABV7D197_9PROT|nr:O-acetylhomoserine aminocarboxypropyltransferase [Kordiimonas pumila]
MTDTPTYGFATQAVHAGAEPDPSTGARVTPIYQTASYVFDSVDHAANLFDLKAFGNIYSRIMNPTVDALEKRIAALEGGVAAVGASSGHGAQLLAIHPLMEPGCNIVAANKLYGGTMNQFAHSFKKMGWGVTFVDPADIEGIAAAIDDKTRAVFIESIANPGGVVVDIAAIADAAHKGGVPLIVDNTLATPYLCQPIKHGADIVVHSMTKFLGGHGTSLGGIVVDAGTFKWKGNAKFPEISESNPCYHGMCFADTFDPFAYAITVRVISLRDLGPCLAPMNAFQILQGVETLHLRMQRHVENTLAVAKFLQGHAAVSWVNYAGLPGDKGHALAQKYAPKGAGAVFTFGLKGGFEAGVKLVENTKLFSHLANIGDVRSLIIHPASTTHRQLSDEAKAKAGAGPDVVRLSVGIEDAADLIADLNSALSL